MRLTLVMGGRARFLHFAPFVVLMLAGALMIGKGLLIPAKAVVAQILLDRAFAEAQDRQQPVKAWSWADNWPVARISVPRLGLHQIVLSGGSGAAMAFGPTLLPDGGVLGRHGTAVFAAHRDTHFRFLKDLRPGDTILVEDIKGYRGAYRVTGGQVVESNRFSVDAYAPTPSIALATCWPFDAVEQGPLRYVLAAELVEG